MSSNLFNFLLHFAFASFRICVLKMILFVEEFSAHGFSLDIFELQLLD